ncbi:MAG: type II toxin-antitoxin system PemK/MazF family toxin [Blautia sp.]|nr:type II toxin-antitoxin system PemK/MazF family toxin [Lachnoclostridium sp.]MCM1210531.1 type II toxin-antitoxin system PemK/MazF family toxin [Blautia sp.]
MKKQLHVSRNQAAGLLKRGDIYYADLDRMEEARGSEQTGKRPVLVIQNDIGNFYAPTTIVAILTTKKKRNLPTHVTLRGFKGLERVSTVCLEQIKTIDKSRLENYRGNIGREAMKEIEKAIAVSLGA